MAKVIGDIAIEVEKCKGCELCIEACPENVLILSEVINQKGYLYALLNGNTCTGCANCAIICPDAIITVWRKVEKKAKS